VGVFFLNTVYMMLTVGTWLETVERGRWQSYCMLIRSCPLCIGIATTRHPTASPTLLLPCTGQFYILFAKLKSKSHRFT